MVVVSLPLYFIFPSKFLFTSINLALLVLQGNNLLKPLPCAVVSTPNDSKRTHLQMHTPVSQHLIQV